MTRLTCTSRVFAYFAAVVCGFMPLFAGAQDVTNGTNTGYPANAFLHGTDIESVQLTNGNLHVQIPIYSAKGRGLDTYGNYVSDNKEWYFNNHCYSSGICVDTVVPEPNSNITLTAHGAMDYAISSKLQSYQCSGTLYAYGETNVVLREPNGTKHHFLPDPASTTAQPCGSITTTNTLYADDGSGWMITLDPTTGTPSTAIAKNGTSIGPEDSNGNQLVKVSSSTGTDTLGRTFYTNGTQYIDSTNTLRSFAVTSTSSVTIATGMCGFSTADQCTEHSATWTPPSVITLPNNQTYTFTYAQSQGGEITSITLPTGGQINYTYGAWQVGGRPVATRTVVSSGVSGQWTYTPNSNNSTTMRDPNGNEAVSDCSAIATGDPCYPKFVKEYSGSVASGVLLKTVNTDYQTFVLGSGISRNIVLPIRQTTTWNQTNQVMKKETDWDSKAVTGGTTAWSNPLEIREFAFGSGLPGALLRKTHFNYKHLQNSSYLAANIADRQTSKIVYDGNGTTIAQTTYAYDGAAVTSTSSVPGHDYSKYSSTNNIRGNLTSISLWRNTDGAWLTTSYLYDDLGNRLSMTDALNHTTNYSYTDIPNGACQPGTNTHAYLTQTTDALGFRLQSSYFYCNGLLASTKDENDIRAGRSGTQYTSYDSLNRPLGISYPDTGSTSYTYGNSVPTTITTTLAIKSGVNKTTVQYLEGMGRISSTQLTSDIFGTDKVDVTYDNMGRLSTITNPYRDSDGSHGTTSFDYDALGRKTIQIQADGSSKQYWCYDGVLAKNSLSPNGQPNCRARLGSTTGEWVDFSDEVSNDWQRITDALGRLTYVFEPSGTSPIPSMETGYSYDSLDNLISVSQWGGPHGASGARNRSFIFDSLSRLVQATNPENGVTCYGTTGGVAPNGSNCTSGYDPNGNLGYKTDARGVTISYSYDFLNRLTQKTYSDSTTPTASFGYDGNDVSGNPISPAVSNAVHRISQSSAAGVSAVSNYSYDPMGRVAKKTSCIPGDCAYDISVTAQYDLAGNLSSYSNGSAAHPITWTYQYDAASRLNQVNSSVTVASISKLLDASSTSPVAYGANGLQYATLGYNTSTGVPLITFRHSYDVRLRPNFSGYYSSANAVLYTYCMPSSGNSNCTSGTGYTPNGNVAGVVDSVNGTWSYAYDTLNRLVRGSATSGPWSGKITCLTFDQFGNRTSESLSTTDCSSNPASINWAVFNSSNSNRIDDSGPQEIFPSYYNVDGSLRNDGAQQYTYDGEGRVCASYNAQSGVATGYVYDAEGNRVGKGSLTSNSCNRSTNGFATSLGFVVGLKGEQLTEISGSNSWQHTNLFIDGKLFATYKGSDVYFSLNDWQGTRRAEVSGLGCGETTYANLPYGDKILTSGACPYTTEHHFTGKEHDGDGNDYFFARYYSSNFARFLTPDWSAKEEPVPYAKLDDPQTLNLYTYVRNNPESMVDEDGHFFAGAYIQNTGGNLCGFGVYFGLCSDGGLDRFLAKNQQGSGKPTNQPVDPEPTDKDGNRTPPPVPVPGCPTCSWVWSPDPQNSRGGRWVPDNYPKTPGGIPGASWDPGSRGGPGHWDVDKGTGSRDRFYPDGRPMPDDVAHPPGWRPIWNYLNNYLNDQWQGVKNYLRDHPYGPNSSPGRFVPPLGPPVVPALP